MQDQGRPPRASEAKVAYQRKQLTKIFSRANDADFLQMIWAVDALQSGRESVAKQFLPAYPPQASLNRSLDSPLGIHRWELETLIVQLFLAAKEVPRKGGNLILDCSQFESMRQAINRLRALENVESARYLAGDFTIWGEMHRIAQRQFHWQRGYFNAPQFYRYSYLYAQGKCATYFKERYGFEVTDLIFVGFGLFSGCLSQPWISRTTSVPEVGLTDEIVQRSLPLMCCSRDEARRETDALRNQAQADHGSPIPTALLPSVLRKTPLIYANDPNQMIAPIPEILLMRVTSGLYYDLLQGGQDVINDANARFERYCIELIDAMTDRLDVSGTFSYGPKGSQFDSPDLVLRDNGKLVAVGECKATRLTYMAQFAENPFEAANKQYTQIAKGVFQLWRFFSHIRRGLIKEELDPNCRAIVITLDAFMQLSRLPQDKVFTEANTLADAEGNITDDDRKHVVICPILDLEQVLSRATDDSLLSSLHWMKDEKYNNWMLSNVHRDTGASREFPTQRPYPFELDGLLPWWSRFDEFDTGEN